jgi:hypothetical protein
MSPLNRSTKPILKYGSRSLTFYDNFVRAWRYARHVLFETLSPARSPPGRGPLLAAFRNAGSSQDRRPERRARQTEHGPGEDHHLKGRERPWRPHVDNSVDNLPTAQNSLDDAVGYESAFSLWTLWTTGRSVSGSPLFSRA